MDRARVGVIGCGNISGIYLANLAGKFANVEVAAVADLLPERAQARAAEHGIARACSVDELLADPGIEVVLNLTVPIVHAEVTLQAIRPAKSVVRNGREGSNPSPRAKKRSCPKPF